MFDDKGERIPGAAGDGRHFQEIHLVVHFMPAATRKYCAVPALEPMVWAAHDKRVARYTQARAKERARDARRRDREAGIQSIEPGPVVREQVVRENRRTATRIARNVYCK